MKSKSHKLIALLVLAVAWCSLGFTTGGPTIINPPTVVGQPLVWYGVNNAHQNVYGPANTVLATYTGTATPTATPTSGATQTPTTTMTPSPAPT